MEMVNSLGSGVFLFFFARVLFFTPRCSSESEDLPVWSALSPLLVWFSIACLKQAFRAENCDNIELCNFQFQRNKCSNYGGRTTTSTHRLLKTESLQISPEHSSTPWTITCPSHSFYTLHRMGLCSGWRRDCLKFRTDWEIRWVEWN